MTVERQVMAIFAGTKGYLDEMPVEHVLRFREEFLEFVESAYPEIGRAIAGEKVVSDETSEKLAKAIDEFKAQFAAEIEG